jgi:hypothetical protein
MLTIPDRMSGVGVGMPVFGLAYEEQAGGRDKGLRLAGVYKLSESFLGQAIPGEWFRGRCLV